MSRCPVCGFELAFVPWVGDSGADEICPSCGIQFGYDDAEPSTRDHRYLLWRGRWIDEGMKWSSLGIAKPEDWDPAEQLKHVPRMRKLGEVDGEGGPFLLADAAAAHSWKGTDTDDYDLLCDAWTAAGAVPGMEIRVGSSRAVTWEPEGACTVHVFADSGQLVLCRCLIIISNKEKLHEESTVLDAAHVPLADFIDIGVTDISSGSMTLLWSPTNGSTAHRRDPRWSMTVGLTPGLYRCVADTIKVAKGTVLRCIVSPIST